MDDAVLKQLDNIVHLSFVDFIQDIRERQWTGREREAISLYAFGFLQQHFRAGLVLSDPTQIGIEAAVPSSPGLGNPKGRVCKDLVLWPQPKITMCKTIWSDEMLSIYGITAEERY